MDYNELALKKHKELKGKVGIASKFKLESKDDLSTAYTPGVAEPCKEIAKDDSKVFDYTMKGNYVAVISDGSAVLGLGNIGPEASMPVMEGKSLIFKEFAGIDAVPICLKTQDTDEIVSTIKNLEPSFGGINLEDISSPRCFEILERLRSEMNIPVFHDDQEGTAVVVLAGIINAMKVVNKNISEVKIVINGAGAAGLSVAKLLIHYGAKNVIVCDSKGAIYKGRPENMNKFKDLIADNTNMNLEKGTLSEIIKGADVFIGVSVGNLLDAEMVSTMNKDAIVIAMANPIPEIMPDEAKKGGVRIIATGRSDFPNQVNNALIFPGMFRGLLDARVNRVNEEMKVAAAEALASIVKEPSDECIIPNVFNKEIVPKVSEAVKGVALGS